MINIGHGTVSNISGQAAIDEEKLGELISNGELNSLEYDGLKHGSQISVQPSDYGFDSVMGELVLSLLDEVAIKRKDERWRGLCSLSKDWLPD
jgi:hypothetical protein